MHRQEEPANNVPGQSSEQEHSISASPEAELTRRVQVLIDNVSTLRVVGRGAVAGLSPYEEAMADLFARCKNPERVESGVSLPSDGEIAHIPDADVGLALLTPADGNVFELRSPDAAQDVIVRYEKLSSDQGVLFTPSHTRRTTEGFALGVQLEDGLPVPHTMRAMRPEVFLNLFALALDSSPTLKQFPRSSSDGQPVYGWSAIRQEIPISLGLDYLEVHKDQSVMDSVVLTPGALAALPTFGGIAYGYSELPFSKSGFEIGEAFSGVSHLTLVTMLDENFVDGSKLTKKALGFPEYQEATERERAEGMFYRAEQADEEFNIGPDGKPAPFKVTYLAPNGETIVTLAFNITYPGVVKKDKKAGISAAVNLRGMALEEHAGAALVRPQRFLGAVTTARSLLKQESATFQQACVLLEGDVDVYREQEFALLHADRDVVLIPEKALFNTEEGVVSWVNRRNERIDLEIHDHSRFILPNGDLVSAHVRDDMLQLIHTDAEGVLIRRNNTASAGGKTETAQSLISEQYLLPVDNLPALLDKVEQMLEFDIKRSDGTFLTPLDPGLPAEELEDKLEALAEQLEFNSIVDDESIAVLMTLKFLLPPSALDEDWKPLLNTQVDSEGDEILHFAQMPVTTSFVLLGETADGEQITAPLKHSLALALRTQTEDDISITVVQPADSILGLGGKGSYNKFVERSDDCEDFHFNRPDEVLRGAGIAPEIEQRLAGQSMGPDPRLKSNILVNWKLQTAADARREFSEGQAADYHPDLKSKLAGVAKGPDSGTYVSPAAVVDENIRLMEPAPHVENPGIFAIAEVSRRLARGVRGTAPLITHAHMAGEKNTILAEQGPTLAFQGPLYLERGMRRAISGLTGKSPSITSEGAEPGIEGPLTKYPFNYLTAFADLNAYAVGRALCEHTPFTTPSGEIGADSVGHNMGYLMTETIARMSRAEIEPDNLLKGGFIEPLPDITAADGSLARGSLLGYRITERFLKTYTSRVLSNPLEYIPARWLRPEQADAESYAEGVETVLRAQRRVASQLLEAGADEHADLAVRASIHMMASEDGTFRFQQEGVEVVWDQNHPDYLALFTSNSLFENPEYRERLEAQQLIDLRRLDKQVAHARSNGHSDRLDDLLELRREVAAEEYVHKLFGTLGADPSLCVRDE